MPETAGPNTANPLLNADGSAALVAAWPMRHLERAAGAGDGCGSVLVSEGVRQRTARLVHERLTRRYEVAIDPANRIECELVRQAIRVTRGGCGWTRWRSPDDVDGSVEEAPRWRILNAREAERFVLERERGGGSVASFVLVLEEV